MKAKVPLPPVFTLLPKENNLIVMAQPANVYACRITEETLDALLKGKMIEKYVAEGTARHPQGIFLRTFPPTVISKFLSHLQSSETWA